MTEECLQMTTLDKKVFCHCLYIHISLPIWSFFERAFDFLPNREQCG